MIRVLKADKLCLLQMRRLFVFIDFHPSLESVQCGSFWCNRTTLDLDLSLSTPLASFSPLLLSDLKIRLLFKNSGTATSAPVASCLITLPPRDTFDTDLSSIPLIGHSKDVEIGLISVNVAVKEITNQPPNVTELKFRHRDGTDWKIEALRHGWKSIQSVQQNWEEMALHFGWTPQKQRSFDVKRGDRLTIEVPHRPDPLEIADDQPRQYVCVVPRSAFSVGPQRMSPYSIIQKFHLKSDFEEKHTREYHSQRGFAFPNLLVEVRPGEYESEPGLKPSTFDPSEQLDALLEVPAAPRFSMRSDVVFQFSGGRRSAPDCVSPIEAFEIPGTPPIVKSPSLERMIDAGETHLVFSFSDSSEEESV